MQFFNKEKLEEALQELSRLHSTCIGQSSFQNLFEVALYFFIIYGKIPEELNNEEDLIKISYILQSYESLFNPEIVATINNLLKGGDK